MEHPEHKLASRYGLKEVYNYCLVKHNLYLNTIRQRNLLCGSFEAHRKVHALTLVF
jgi:hypothetical protein